MKERKPTKPFTLLSWYSPVWSTGYSGEEYEPDGRDWRELRIFLEVNPETLEKREVFVSRAVNFLEDKFWTETGHRLFHFLKHYGRYGSHKKTPKSNAGSVRMIVCADCKKPFDASKECDNPDCPTNAWKKMDAPTQEAKDMIAGLMNSMTVPPVSGERKR